MADILVPRENTLAMCITADAEETNCEELVVPDHAIQRFARFLLPRIQESLEQEQHKAG